MHAQSAPGETGESPPEPLAYALPPTPPTERPTAGEWAIGIAFVLAALAIVAGIAWTVAGLAA